MSLRDAFVAAMEWLTEGWMTHDDIMTEARAEHIACFILDPATPPGPPASEPRWRCKGCGLALSEEDVYGVYAPVTYHIITGFDSRGEVEQTQCGPVERVEGR
jgi:hypothetical protein